jgi:hypothetical protein
VNCECQYLIFRMMNESEEKEKDESNPTTCPNLGSGRFPSVRSCERSVSFISVPGSGLHYTVTTVIPCYLLFVNTCGGITSSDTLNSTLDITKIDDCLGIDIAVYHFHVTALINNNFLVGTLEIF